MNNENRIPQNICDNCVRKVCSAGRFRETCENSRIILEKYFDPVRAPCQEIEKKKFDFFSIDQRLVECEKLYDIEVEVHDDPILTTEIDQNHSEEIYTEEISIYKNLTDELTIEGQQVNLQLSTEELQTNTCCTLCKQPFETNDLLDKHMRQKHEKQKYDCMFCGKEFQSSGNLKNHMDTHNKENAFTCNVCGRGFKSKLYMERHRKMMHTITHHQCPHCNLNFNNSVKYEYHLKSHDPNKKYKCQYCPKSFLQRHHCDNHERTHTKDRPYLCSICGNDFNNKTNLQVHMKRHSGVKPYKCDECDKAFVQSQQLKYHKRGVHENPTARVKSKSDMASDSIKRTHICPECGRSFKRPEHLKNHINGVHLKQKPFACDVIII